MLSCANADDRNMDGFACYARRARRAYRARYDCRACCARRARYACRPLSLPCLPPAIPTTH